MNCDSKQLMHADKAIKITDKGNRTTPVYFKLYACALYTDR